MNNLKEFVIELKDKIRNSGRTNVILISEIDELFIKYDIRVNELKNE